MGAERGQQEGVFHQHQQNVVNQKVFSIESPFSWTSWSSKQRFPTIRAFLQQNRERRKPLNRHYRKRGGKPLSIDQEIDGKRFRFGQKSLVDTTSMANAR